MSMLLFVLSALVPQSTCRSRFESIPQVCRLFFQAEDGIRYLVRSRGLGDVYKRQVRSELSGPGRIEHGDGDVGAIERHVVVAAVPHDDLSLIHI